MRIVHVTSFFQLGMVYQENCLTPAQVRLGRSLALPYTSPFGWRLKAN
jgi:hypothetical protein